MTQAVIWDWNGTLLDDVDISFDILNKLLRENHFPEVRTLEEYRRIFGFPVQEYYLRAGFNFENKSYQQLAEEYTVEYASKVSGCKLHKNARETLSALKSRGIKQIILSASMQPLLENQVAALGLTPYFDELIGTKDVLAHGKLKYGLEWKMKNNIQNALMCGDTLHDFEVGTALSARCVLFCNGHYSRARLLQANTTVIEDLAQLLQLL